jgi:hypothetical protein
VLQLHERVMVALVAHIAATCPPEEGVLFVLADQDDVNAVEKALVEHPLLGQPGAIHVLHLHDDLSVEEQLRAARGPSQGATPCPKRVHLTDGLICYTGV